MREDESELKRLMECAFVELRRIRMRRRGN